MQVKPGPFIELWLICKDTVQAFFWKKEDFQLTNGFLIVFKKESCISYCHSGNVTTFLFTRMGISGIINNCHIPKSMCSHLSFKLLTRPKYASIYSCHLHWRDYCIVRRGLFLSGVPECWKGGFRNWST